MTVYTVTIPTPIYEATAGKDATRPVLQGVHLEYESPGVARLSAADGFILATVACDADLPEDFEPILIPGSFIKSVWSKGSRSASWTNRLYITVNEPGTVAGVHMRNKDGNEVQTTLIQGRFPDYRKLIPFDRNESSQYQGWYVSFNPKLVSRLCKALDEESFTVSIVTPTSPGVIANEHGVGVIMPMFTKGSTSQVELVERLDDARNTGMAHLRKELVKASITIEKLEAAAKKVTVKA
jgi:DNA polymerase III sliding clamp (beta) subunit (PCNA family)